MSDRSDFLTRMSHELRTPINSVISYTEMLQRGQDGTLTARQTEHLRTISENGRLLLAVLNDVADLARIEGGKLELRWTEVDPAALVQEVVHGAIGKRRRGNVRLRTELPPEVLPLRTDRARLAQILRNLVGNALKFTSSGEAVVRLAVEEGSGRPLWIAVSDTGPGIPADRRETIFEPFQHFGGPAPKGQGGTGLGLTVCRALCELLGYRLEVESRLGEGSTFTVLFEGEEGVDGGTDPSGSVVPST